MTNKATKRLHDKVNNPLVLDSYKKKIRWIRRNKNIESMYILLFYSDNI